MKTPQRLLVLFVLFVFPLLGHTNNYPSASDSLRYLIQHAPTPDQRAELLAELGWELRRDSPVVALEVLEKAILLALPRENLKASSLAYNTMGTIHRDQNHPRKAIGHFRLAIDQRLESGDRGGAANVMVNLGKVLDRIDRSEEALEQYQDAIAIYQELDQPADEAKALNLAGAVCRKMERFKESFEFLSRSIEIRRVQGPSHLLGLSILNMANLHMEEKHYARALEQFHAAAGYFGSPSQKKNLAAAWNGIGAAHLLLEELDSAQYYTQKSADAKLELGDTVGWAGSLVNLAMVDNELGKGKEARALLREAIGIFEEREEHRERLSATILLGRLLVEEGNPEGDSLLESALNLSGKEGSLSFKREILTTLAGFHHDQDRNEEAFSMLRESLGILMELDRRLTQAIEFETQYIQDQSEQERRNLRLLMEISRQESIISRQRLVSMFTLALILLAALLAWVLLRQKIEKQRYSNRIDYLIFESGMQAQAARIQGAMEEKRSIARDLHDQIGSSLAVLRLQLEAAERQLSNLLDKASTDPISKALLNLDQIMAETRELSHRIDRQSGILSETRDFARVLTETGLVKIQVFPRENHPFEHLAPEKERELSMIVRELVTNSLKHARPRNIEIQFLEVSGQLHLSVSDDGEGFDLKRSPASGMGLRSIEDRIRKLNGEFTLDSSPGNGTSAFIELPLENTRT